jgi:2-haloacid dehalogenase
VVGSQIPRDISALIFDTGGTIFDWHTAVVEGFTRVGAARGVDADWPAMTKTWRRLSTTMVDQGLPSENGRAVVDMDDVLLTTLQETLDTHSTTGFTAADQAELVLAWRRMQPWPDVPSGLPRLRSRFVVAPFTILKAALVIQASRRGGLSWDTVISCEMIGVYKTHPDTYATAARWLDQPHDGMLLVTTHNNDLEAAHRFGFHTAFIYRPDEWRDIASLDPEPSELADFVAQDLDDLADQLGA